MWFGAFTSTTGVWMQQVAEAWVVLDLTGSAFYLGLTAFLGQLPIILFTLVVGVVADRIDRRKLLLGSQYVQMTGRSSNQYRIGTFGILCGVRGAVCADVSPTGGRSRPPPLTALRTPHTEHRTLCHPHLPLAYKCRVLHIHAS